MNPNNETRQSLYYVAYVFAIIGTVLLGFAIIPLIWCIPMTKRIRCAKLELGTPLERQHLLLAILSFILLSWISGICILIADFFVKNEI